MRAKKSLGQHFLTSTAALAHIIDAGDIHADDIVLEIGPGTGVLTERLLTLAGKVIAIEKDHDLIETLRTRFAAEIATGRFDLIEGDVLSFDPTILRAYNYDYKLIANIPYYITGAIIEHFLSTAFQPTRMVLLIQKEVAERIVARDGKESVLSIAVKAYGTPRIVAKVPRGAFTPAPKVDSAILSITSISRDFFAATDETSFFTLLKFVFGKKRGQLGGRLATFIGDRARALDLLASCDLTPTLRAENLSPEQWKRLANTVAKGA